MSAAETGEGSGRHPAADAITMNRRARNMGCGPGEWERVEEILPDGTGKIHKRTLYRRKKDGPFDGSYPTAESKKVTAPSADPCEGYLAVPETIASGSMLVASGTGEWYWLAPGSDGDRLMIVSGQPCWVP